MIVSSQNFLKCGYLSNLWVDNVSSLLIHSHLLFLQNPILKCGYVSLHVAYFVLPSSTFC